MAERRCVACNAPLGARDRRCSTCGRVQVPVRHRPFAEDERSSPPLNAVRLVVGLAALALVLLLVLRACG